MRSIGRQIEDRGFDAVYMSGHVLGEPGATVLDPMIALAAVAGATERIKLITSILLLPHYNPVLLANEAASLDVISGGRFSLGIGVGWNRPEFEAVGVPFKERGARADDGIEVMKALWNERPAGFDGRFSSFHDAYLGTAPQTPGGPHLWVGGQSDAALRRALRHGEAWHGTGESPAEVTEVRERLVRLGHELGRDPATLQLTGVYGVVPPIGIDNGFRHGHMLGGEDGNASAVAEDIGRLQEAGLEAINVLLAVTGESLPEAIDWLAAEVLPAFDGKAAE